MPIERGTVVTLTYELKDPDGELLEEENAMMAYLHGAIRAPSFPALLRDYRSHPPSTTVPPTKRKDAA